jgi:S1-C subfamily serine protease
VPGDLIRSIAGRTVASPAALGSIVRAQKPGARVSVGYVDQSGTSRTATVTLVAGPAQ